MDPFAANETPVASDDAIVARYPQPLARAWQRVLIASPRPSFHHRQLLVLAETLAFYLGAVAVSAYDQYRAEGGPPDPALNRSRRSLRRPTFGQWLGWVRLALAAIPPAAALLPGLRDAYEATDTGMLLLGYEGLRALMVVQLGYTGEYGAREAASPRLLLELINGYQLRRVAAPPAAESGFDEMAVVTVLAPGLRAALGQVALLAAYPLLGLVRGEGGGVEVLRLQGLAPAESGVELDPEAAPPGTLLLADPDELPMLVLDPWLIYVACPECGQLEIAAFAGQEGAALRYHGLECEHTWSQTPEVRLAEVALAGPDPASSAAGWTPDPGAFPAEEWNDTQAQLFAQLEAESAALEADRRARRAPAAPAPAASTPPPAHEAPQDVYLDLLAQRAQGGLTLDQLQDLDEARAATEDQQRRDAEHP